MKIRINRLASYAELRRLVGETFLAGKRKIEEEKVRTYWQAGSYINEHIRLHGGRAKYGKEVLIRLGVELEVDESVLRRCAEFHNKFPVLPIRAPGHELPSNPDKIKKNQISDRLTWSHYRALLPVEDSTLRYQLASQAERFGWDKERLESQVKKITQRFRSGIQDRSKNQTSAANANSKDRLEPKRGRLLTFPIREKQGELYLDHGFRSYWKLTDEQSRIFKAGDWVEMRSEGTLIKVETLKNPKEKLFTYEADCTKVIDADTFWMDLYPEGRSRPPLKEEKLRLRGIDAPELDTPEGKAAKRFVEKLFAAPKKITVTTTKPDKWDRYLSDVFLTMPDGSEVFLNNLLLEKGFARLKTSYAPSDWEK